LDIRPILALSETLGLWNFEIVLFGIWPICEFGRRGRNVPKSSCGTEMKGCCSSMNENGELNQVKNEMKRRTK
jgi:hypothetical protein